MRAKSILGGALILTAAGLITRVLGFGYRIFMSNAMGAEGMGLYQLVLPIYGLGWSIACSGFTTTISKLTAQENAKEGHGNIRVMLAQAIAVTAGIGLAFALALYFGADIIANNFLKDPRTALSLRILAPCFPFMAVGSCMRGYFFGMQRTLVPALNQVFEQTVRMAVVFCLAGFMIPMGLEYACAAATIGVVVEEISSLGFILLAFKFNKVSALLKKAQTIQSSRVFIMIMTMALPLTGNRVAGSLLSTLENALMPQRLQLYGMTGMTAHAAMSMYGRIMGMAMPLIFFPSAFLVSLSISLVPAVSEAASRSSYSRVRYAVERSMLFCAVIGFCAAAVFVTFNKELGQVVYHQDLSQYLLWFGLMCPLMYMNVVLSGVLNGLGYQMFIFRNSLLSSTISIAFIYFLVPVSGITAFITGWFFSLVVVCWLELDKLNRNGYLSFDVVRWLLKPLLCAVFAGVMMTFLLGRGWLEVFGQAWELLFGLCITGALYIGAIFLTRCLTYEDIAHLFKFRK